MSHTQLSTNIYTGNMNDYFSFLYVNLILVSCGWILSPFYISLLFFV